MANTVEELADFVADFVASEKTLLGGLLVGASVAYENNRVDILLNDPFLKGYFKVMSVDDRFFRLVREGATKSKKKRHPILSCKRNTKVLEMRRAIYESLLQYTRNSTISVLLSKFCLTLVKDNISVSLQIHIPVNSTAFTGTHYPGVAGPPSTLYVTGADDIPRVMPMYYNIAWMVSPPRGNILRRNSANATYKEGLTGLYSQLSANNVLHNPDMETLPHLFLEKLENEVKLTVQKNSEVVRDFADLLQKEFLHLSLLEGADVMHAGSAYEKLSVKTKTDFDVIVVLSKPFVGENFEVIRDPSKFFELKWKSHLPDRSFRDASGFLHSEELQEHLFRALTTAVERVKLPNASVSCRPGLASLDVQLTTSWGDISVDLSPQIPVHSWGNCPDLTELGLLPACLRLYIHHLNFNKSPVMFFSPAVPGRHRHQHRLCNVSFSMLEKKFLRSNGNIRQMVRLVKATAECRGWKKKFGLKSFHMKRVAIKYADNLKNNPLWDGYKLLLQCLRDELQSTDTLDGFFVKNQVTYKKKPEKVKELIAEIDSARQWSPQMLMREWDNAQEI